MAMTAATNVQATFELLKACVDNLGAAIVPIWGVNERGHCRCPKGEACRSAGKHPNSRLAPEGVKNSTRDPSIIRQWIRQAPHGNYALRCGEPVPGGGFLGAFDWDPRNGSDASLEDIRSRGDELPDTVTQASGGGGGHRLYRFATSPASRSIAPGLDLQGAGKYIVVSPSKHASGGVYAWELGQSPGEIALADAPAWIAEATEEAVSRPTLDGVSGRETVLGEAFALAGRAGVVLPDGSMIVNCPQSDLHSDGRGRGQDASTVILPPAGGSRFGGFKCLHGHCANLKWKDVMDSFSKEIRDRAYAKYPRLGLVPPPAFEAPPPRASIDEEEQPSLEEKPIANLNDPRLKDCINRVHFKPDKGSAGAGVAKSDIVNVITILTHDPRWKGLLRWDEFAQVLRLTRKPFWHIDDAPKDESNVWHDNHVTCLNLWLRRNWLIEMEPSRLHEAVYVVGRRDSINPLKTYLKGLQWDGVPRLETWLTTYAGVEDNSYARLAGRKWILSAVARAFEPGCKVDTCIILEGPQGKGKSTLLRVLATGSANTGDGPQGAWFSDTPIDLASKDAYVALRGKWILELAELASLKKADLDRAKAFFSSPVDSYRPPYGREQITVPRTTVFAGTVNLSEYLNDPTGGRRFIPVRCGVIDLDGLVADRDQLWAEAVSLYGAWADRGRKQSECLWWPSPEETPLFEAEQIKRQVAGAIHPWVEGIALWVHSQKAKDLIQSRGHIMMREIALHALNIADKDLDPSSMTTIGMIMVKELGWMRKPVTIGNAKTWAYTPDPNRKPS